jgi:hypothetical protein
MLTEPVRVRDASSAKRLWVTLRTPKALSMIIGRILVTSDALPRVIRVQASHCLNPWTSLSKASRYSLQNWITVTSLSSTLNAYDLFPITGSGVPGSAKK